MSPTRFTVTCSHHCHHCQQRQQQQSQQAYSKEQSDALFPTPPASPLILASTRLSATSMSSPNPSPLSSPASITIDAPEDMQAEGSLFAMDGAQVLGDSRIIAFATSTAA